MKTAIGVVTLLLLLLLSACAPTKTNWQIKKTETANLEKGVIKGSTVVGENGSILKNTILLNNKTGETYLLWPNEGGYTWKELKH